MTTANIRVPFPRWAVFIHSFIISFNCAYIVYNFTVLIEPLMKVFDSKNIDALKEAGFRFQSIDAFKEAGLHDSEILEIMSDSVGGQINWKTSNKNKSGHTNFR